MIEGMNALAFFRLLLLFSNMVVNWHLVQNFLSHPSPSKGKEKGFQQEKVYKILHQVYFRPHAE